MSDDSKTEQTAASYFASPWFYFLLVFTLSIPFYILGAAGGRLPVATFLPMSALMAFLPAVAALGLVYREQGAGGAKAFLGRALDYRRIKGLGWVLAVLLLMPFVFVIAYGVLKLEGRVLPDLHVFSIARIIAFTFMFFFGAIGEELGWQGYAFTGLKNGRSALAAALIIGMMWALWHVIPFAEMGRSVDWIVWQCLGAIAMRIIIVWLCVNTGQSVFIAVLFHMMINMPWGIFTTFESYFDPFVVFVILVLVAGIVVVLWSPDTLGTFGKTFGKTFGRRDQSRHDTLARKVAVGLALAVGSLALAASIAFRILLPAFHFPLPTGRYAIGTVTYHWVDIHRPDIFSVDPKALRELMVQVWYPARPDPSAPHAPYLADADEVTAAFARVQHVPRFLFASLQHVTTNAVSSAPFANDLPNFPVVIFLEGATGFRQMNTYQIEELVSHGYIVAAIDQPGAAATVVFPDGHQEAGLTVSQFHAMVGSSYLPGVTAPRLNGNVLQDNSIVPYLAKDVSFSLDEFAVLNRNDPKGILTGKMDMQHVGAFGISLGGIVAGESCLREARIKACLAMDAPMSTDVVEAGLSKPTMWITRDAASMRLERDRSGGWPETEIQAHQTSMRAVYNRLPGAGYFVSVPGMFHSNFTDIPYWSPILSQAGITGPIDRERAHAIVNAYSVAFFDRHLKGRSVPLLAGTSSQYAEATFESRPH